MVHNGSSLNKLVAELRKLPGIGEKSAVRLAFHLARNPERLDSLSRALEGVRERIRRCSVCCTLTEEDPCPICRSRRESATICVVQDPQDVEALERSGTYGGGYHVLHGVLSPLTGQTPDRLTIGRLLERIDQGGITEVIIATSFSVEGEATAHYIASLLRERNVKITRPAHGIPTGGDLEYLDPLTLRHALSGRREIDDR